MILEAATPAERKKLMKVLQLAPVRQKASKYKNKRVWADGHKFDSLGEYGHWLKLVAREERGEITDLRAHQVYELRAAPLHAESGPVKVGRIIPDYDYVENGKSVTADFKGMVTKEWKFRAKIFKANYGREILVVKK